MADWADALRRMFFHSWKLRNGSNTPYFDWHFGTSSVGVAVGGGGGGGSGGVIFAAGFACGGAGGVGRSSQDDDDAGVEALDTYDSVEVRLHDFEFPTSVRFAIGI